MIVLEFLLNFSFFYTDYKTNNIQILIFCIDCCVCVVPMKLEYPENKPTCLALYLPHMPKSALKPLSLQLGLSVLSLRQPERLKLFCGLLNRNNYTV